MELAETPGTLGAVALPLTGAVSPPKVVRAVRERLLSLDVMRGFAVVGMIVVNTLAFSNDAYGYRPASAFLAHAPWAGFTFADFVFPAFIFMAGFSVAVSLRRNAGLDWRLFRRVASRSAALLVIGFLLTNIGWFGQMDHGTWRPMGVLQRIGLCYFATALLFATCGPRTRPIVAGLMLVLYWPLTLLPVHGQAVNLLVPGANFASWFDRTILGPHLFVAGPHGFDPEGLLSTLPAIAQCLLGASVGEWLLRNRDAAAAPQILAFAGAACAILGLAWSPFFPIVKNIWTSSFVLFSTGLALLLLSLCYWALDRRRLRFPAVTFLEAFGLNALLAYVLQGLAQLLPAGDDMHALGAASLKSDASMLVANLPVLAFILMLWAPLEFLRRRRWIVKI
ncbi:MAG TPA: heparan-alpha-glucosaminide N-acetyltransferase domain-containing protein [Rhizomicrobium sp.]|jgi:predicted acyltransferase|nr:heparan-alpha-glucosaminide N-acetyltransferase domain-containing protein [Rhizomicrobium sp.]